MTELHRCKDCGLLGVRHRDSRELVEVEKSARLNGTFDIPNLNQRYDAGFFCVAGFIDHQLTTGRHELVEGVFRPRDESKRLENCKTELKIERRCTEFIKWRLGFSPKEHIEMSWLAEQRAWQQQCDRETQAWRAKQDAEAEQRHNDSLREARRMHWRELFFLGLVVGGLACVATIAAAFIERNSLFRDPQIEAPVTSQSPADSPTKAAGQSP